MTDQTAAWIDGDPLMEAIAADVWAQCRTEGTSLVVDDPRNIAAVAAAVARAHAASPAPAADRAAPEEPETEEQRADREETERAHDEGDHAYCGPTCEVEFPSEVLRNTILCRAVPGSAGMLDELLRRAAVLPAPADRAAEEAYRLSLSTALRLGTGANWEAIRDRAEDLVAEVEDLTAARRRLLDQRHPDTDQTADRAAVLREAADAIDTETRQAKADEVLEPDKYRPCRDASAQLRRMAEETRQPEAVAELGCAHCGHSEDRHMGDEHERGCHVCWDLPGNSGWKHRFRPGHKPDAETQPAAVQQPKEA